MALSTTTLDEFLRIGKWTATAEDNIYGEMFPSSFFRNIYTHYQANPGNQANIDAIGLFSLGLAIAGWGISDTDNLPPDADERGYKSTSSTGSGKHIMSYAKGGVGIPHADSSFLENIFEEIKKNHRNLAPEFDRFYALKGHNFDVQYANGGHCTHPVSTLITDLDGNTFGHTVWGYAGSSYCGTYNSGKTTPEDWVVFRHWIRAALRTKSMQQYIIDYWIGHYWQPSYEKTMAAGGSIPEALVNCRIRNSGSVKANSNVGKCIEEQLKNYGKESRWGVMLRSANIWEYFDGVPISRKPGQDALPNTWSTATSATTSPPGSGPEDQANASHTGMVTASALNIRSGAGSSYGTVARALPKGTKVTILAENNGWYEVTTKNGIQGWVSSGYVTSEQTG